MIKNNNFKFLMNNSDVKYIYNIFDNYNIQKIICKRKINSKKPQSYTNELIITNY